MDIVTYALLNKKIKGLASGVKSATVQGTSIVFTMNDGSKQTITFPTPADGVSITDVDINADKHLIVKLSDNRTIDAGLVPTVKGDTGSKGKDGINGKDGVNGADGVDGISPTVTITEATGRHTVSITDKDGVHSFVVKDGSALDVNNYYTKDEANSLLDGKADKADIPTVPTNLSELTNDENFIKNTVDNLTNYYKKNETYTQEEINELVSNLNKLTTQIVEKLPTENIDTSTIYLVKQGETNNYMQYMHINSTWAELGSTEVNLSSYVTLTKMNEELNKKADKSEIPVVPTKVSAFTNDVGYLTEYTETDPTVPAWAKSPTKPSYSAEEIGALPDDTEIPIFTNKEVLDKISEEKVESWDGAATAAHTHSNKVVLDKLSESDGKLTYNGAGVGSAGGGGMTLIASVADVNTTSKTIEGFDFNVGDRYYFEAYYFINPNDYSKQYIFTEKVITIIELPMHSKIPFNVLNNNGVPATGDSFCLNINFNANGSLQLWTWASRLTKLNIYKLD